MHSCQDGAAELVIGEVLVLEAPRHPSAHHEYVVDPAVSVKTSSNGCSLAAERLSFIRVPPLPDRWPTLGTSHKITISSHRAGPELGFHLEGRVMVESSAPSSGRLTAPDAVSMRRWAFVAVLANAAFIVGIWVAPAWQGPRYSLLVHTISDTYAVTAPGGAFMVVLLTVSGAAVIMFSVRSLWPTLRPVRAKAMVAATLLVSSILGQGDLLTPFEREACRLADPRCTTGAPTANVGGRLDGILSLIGLVSLVAFGFVLASAMRGASAWQGWAVPTRAVTVLVLALIVATALSDAVHLGGLVQRLLASTAAGAVAVLARAVVRQSDASRQEAVPTEKRPPPRS